jgi:putative membrane protein
VTDFNPGYLLNAIVYSVVGIVIFSLAFAVIDRLTPYNLWKEICENRNTALAIVVGAVSIGVCIIIASAVN